MDFSIYGIVVRPMAEMRQDFEKWFLVSGEGVKNEAIPIFAKFSKNHVLSFLLMSGLCAINSIQ